MPIIEQPGNSIETRKAHWVSIHLSGGEDVSGEPHPSFESEPMKTELPPLFVHSQQTRATLPERFPRLTFLAIAAALLLSALTAEFDYLRGAGYYWPGR